MGRCSTPEGAARAGEGVVRAGEVLRTGGSRSCMGRCSTPEGAARTREPSHRREPPVPGREERRGREKGLWRRGREAARRRPCSGGAKFGGFGASSCDDRRAARGGGGCGGEQRPRGGAVAGGRWIWWRLWRSCRMWLRWWRSCDGEEVVPGATRELNCRNRRVGAPSRAPRTRALGEI